MKFGNFQVLQPVAIRFWAIDDGTPHVYKNNKQPKDQQKALITLGAEALKPPAVDTSIKALHIEINKSDPPAFKKLALKPYIHLLQPLFDWASKCNLYAIKN